MANFTSGGNTSHNRTSIVERKRLALVVFGVGTVLWTAWLIRGLLLSIVVAGFLAILFEPVRRRLLRRFPGSRGILASLLTAAALLTIVLPTAFVLYLLLGEIMNAFTALKADIGTLGVQRLFEGRLPPPMLTLVHQLQRLVPVPTAQLQDQFAELAQRVPHTVGSLVGVSARSLVNLLFVGFGLFYFFLDGEAFVTLLREISPFDPGQTRAFFREFEDVSWAMVFGSAVSVVVGGALCVLGFWLFQVPNPLFWGAFAGLFTLAPGLGSALVWVPLAAFLALQGHLLQAGEVVAYCIVALVVVNDTLLRPILVGQRLRLHPYLILLSIFGGVEAYGIAGLLVGPMAAALAVATLRLYRRDMSASPHEHSGEAIETVLDASGESPTASQ